MENPYLFMKICHKLLSGDFTVEKKDTGIDIKVKLDDDGVYRYTYED